MSVATLALVIWAFPGSDHTDAEAATTAKLVDGHVYNLGGQPAAGAEVRVEIWGGYWPDLGSLRTSQMTDTDSSGHYQVIINANYWDPHNTIWVYANDSISQGETKVEADAQADQMVNVTLDLAIPEFGIPVVIASVSVPVILKTLQARRKG